MKKTLIWILSVLMILSVVACGTVSAPEGEQKSGTAVTAEDFMTLNTSSRGEGNQTKATAKFSKTVAIEDAFIRGGTYGNQSMHETKISNGYLNLSSAGGNLQREILVKFDLSTLDLNGKNTVYLRLDFNDGGTHANNEKIWVDAFLYSNDWKETTVTYNNAPAYRKSDYVGKGMSIKMGVTQIDVTDVVMNAKARGEEIISFRLVQQIASRSPASAYSIASKESRREKPTLLAVESAENYTTDILWDQAQNRKVWEYSETLYNEWYARYQEILAKGDDDAEKIHSNPDDCSITVDVKDTPSSSVVKRPTRTISTLSNYDTQEYETDAYGGVISDMKFEATGRFYTKEVNGRWWVITPLGNPCILRGLNHMNYAYSGNSPYQTAAMLRVYGSSEKWAIAATRWVMDDLGFNAAAGEGSDIWNVERGLSMTVRRGYSGMATYLSSHGLMFNGSPIAARYNNAMPVFDPEFFTYVDGVAKETVEYYGNRLSQVLGYTSDNELPVTDDMLIGFLTLDPFVAENLYSYTAAWTWYKNITGEENPSVSDIYMHSERLGVDLLDLFKGFVYDRYYCAFSTAYDKYDPEGLFLGVRLYISCDRWEWLARFTGYWCDMMCINYYHAWEIEEEDLYNLERWAGCPLFITEFYSKGADAIAADGKPFANTHGAGFVVPTQTDKGYFYQNFCLRLLECKNCVGWLYFQYIDNNPLDADIHPAASNSNKGIVTSDHDTEAYRAFTSQMAMLNKNVYSLIEFFDGEKYFE